MNEDQYFLLYLHGITASVKKLIIKPDNKEYVINDSNLELLPEAIILENTTFFKNNQDKWKTNLNENVTQLANNYIKENLNAIIQFANKYSKITLMKTDTEEMINNNFNRELKRLTSGPYKLTDQFQLNILKNNQELIDLLAKLETEVLDDSMYIDDNHKSNPTLVQNIEYDSNIFKGIDIKFSDKYIEFITNINSESKNNYVYLDLYNGLLKYITDTVSSATEIQTNRSTLNEINISERLNQENELNNIKIFNNNIIEYLFSKGDNIKISDPSIKIDRSKLIGEIVEVLYNLCKDELLFWFLCIIHYGRGNINVEEKIFNYYFKKMRPREINNIIISKDFQPDNINQILTNAFINKINSQIPGKIRIDTKNFINYEKSKLPRGLVLDPYPKMKSNTSYVKLPFEKQSSFTESIFDHINTFSEIKDARGIQIKEDLIKNAARKYCHGEGYNLSNDGFWNDTKRIDTKISEWADNHKKEENPSGGGNVFSKIVKTVKSISNFKDSLFNTKAIEDYYGDNETDLVKLGIRMGCIIPNKE